ncbi:DUF2180 family protein [Methanosalsum natronophilum]|uniref:DUF2180 family protein n=1 Tax=Methanosalsum natronophilum TaxID=768733 RepID=UPI002168FB8F|nr:DUF2180 family protein [Methanosalsum natronophilum]MCS3923460.1 hypothetical protein [Methanosalsum natronophilum]
MKCYECIESKKQTEAVSVCIICGMGLCMDHIKVLEIPVSTGKYPEFKECTKPLPRFTCNDCLGNIMVDAFD